MTYINYNENLINDIIKRKEFIENLENLPSNNNSKSLILAGYQRFIVNFLGPNTKYDRLLLIHSTGVGKTITSLSLAKKFQDKSIFILGFTKHVFKHELFTRPEFGIVTENEMEKIKNLKSSILKYNLERDIIKLRDIQMKLSSRLKYNFIGYKELFNKLVIVLDKSVHPDLNKISNKEDLFLLEKAGKIKINNAFIRQFENSFIICDEVHNIYNSLEINNWGICLQIIFDFVESSKILLLSATPLTNSQLEIVSLLKLLNRDCLIDIKDIFNNTNEVTKSGEELIKKLSYGKVSYLRDKNVDSYPRKNIIGTSIPGISILKFIRCEMTDHHLEVYKHENPVHLESINKYLTDMVFPLEDGTIVFRKNDIRKKPTGDFLIKENLKFYSAKYFKMLSIIEDIIKNKKGKVMIYHNSVQMSGTDIIVEILKMNGMLNITDSSTDKTRCSYCYETRDSHTSKIKHSFNPIKFICVNGSNKIVTNKNIEKFNDSMNKDGDYIKIIIGSKAIKESYDLKCVTSLIIAHQPDNIATLMQVFGRVIRKNSHILLDYSKRVVDIYILVSSLPTLSLEEEKYISKVKTYAIIRNIISILASNAIDVDLNHDINSINSDIILPNKRKINYTTINYTTFRAYYYSEEIEFCKKAIKQAFNFSKVFIYDDLLHYIKNPEFSYGFNAKLISENSFIVALNSLVLTKTVIYRHQYYILPSSNGSIKYDSIYRINSIDNPLVKIDSSPDTLSSIINKYKDSNIEDIIYSTDQKFHIRLIEFLVEYFFKLYTTGFASRVKSPNHDIYFKLLYRYNKFKIIVFAGTYSDIRKIYSNHIIITDKSFSSYKIAKTESDLFLSEKNNKKIFDYLLPVGYTFDNKIKILNDEYKWNTIKYKIDLAKKYKDNNIIVGILDSPTIGQNINFKLREPELSSTVKNHDNRKNKLGMACVSYSKAELYSFCDKLGITDYKDRKDSICDIIKDNLIKREINERKNKTNIKYVYFYFES